MAARFLAQLSGAEEIPAVAEALRLAAASIQRARDLIEQQVDALLAAKAEIRIPAVFDLQAQLDAALDFQAGFSAQISDPLAFVQELLQGVAQVEAALASIGPPEVALEAQLGASREVSAALELKIGLVDLKLALLDSIAAVLRAVRDGMLPALDAYAALASSLAAAGCYSFAAESPLSQLGTDLALVLPESGIPASTPVLAVVLLAPATNVSAQNAIRATFKVIP